MPLTGLNCPTYLNGKQTVVSNLKTLCALLVGNLCATTTIAVGEVFQTQVNSALRNRVAHAVFQRMVIRKDQDVAPVSTGMINMQYLYNTCLTLTSLFFRKGKN